MERVKVLQVIGGLRIGGAEKVAVDLLRYIDKTKYEFHYLVYGDEQGGYEDIVKQMGGKVIHMQRPSGLRIKFKRDLIKVIKVNGPYQIVHSHLLFHSGTVLEAAKKAGVPIRVAHSHSTQNIAQSNEKIISKWIQKIYQHKMRHKINEYSTIKLACGKKAGEYLYGKDVFRKEGICFRNRIEVEKFGYDIETRKRLREKMGFGQKRVFGHIGHLDEVKNHNFLLDIYAIIAQKEDSVLLLIGDGNLKQKLKNKVKELNIENKVLFLGNRDDVSELLQAIDIVIMPSFFEGFPLSLIEAQASGVRIFASDTITKEVNVTNTITYLPLEKGARFWADVILKNCEYCRKTGVNILKKRGYDIETLGKDLEDVYKEQKRK